GSRAHLALNKLEGQRLRHWPGRDGQWRRRWPGLKSLGAALQAAPRRAARGTRARPMQSKPNGPLQTHRSGGHGRSTGAEYAALTAVSRQSLFSTVRGMGAVRRAPSDNFSVGSSANANRCNLTLREMRKQRRRDMKERFGAGVPGGGAVGGAGCAGGGACASSGARYSRRYLGSRIVFDPAGQFIHWWCTVVSLAFLYNLWVILFRVAFMEIEASTMKVWFPLDYTMDLINLLDIAVSFRTGYLEDGVLQTDQVKMRLHYMDSTRFYIDCLCMLPLDLLYLSFDFQSIVRAFRLCKVYKFFQFLDRTERHANYPNLIRSLKLGHYLMLIIHTNACVLKLVIQNNPDFLSHAHLHNDSWRAELWYFPNPNTSRVDEQYLFSLYWSSMAVSLMAEMPKPNALWHYVFVICEIVFCLLLFATVLGHVSNIVANTSMARRDFQGCRRSKVIRWFDYLWSSHKTVDEEKILSLLPDKLKAEMAIHVHLDTLKQVEMFQNTEEGFLSDLVLCLRPVLFSPGDFVCRKGEVGKHMYIISRGKLQVVAEDCKKVLATLRPGSYFGELSILNMGTMGNRRTASVKSVGYSDLFCLSKTDLWDVLKDYPAARVKLEAIAAKRLQAFKKKPIEE
uniref:Cyclic nucleotide-binding domain-containing protein n=1 Tax=Macrostomum lignano TaxID=282301 RepID=A0A1I8HPL1_9PLAT